jgi:hypothetical protein
MTTLVQTCSTVPKEVGAQDEVLAVLHGEFTKQGEHFVAARGIEPVRGLVQKEQIRVVDQRGGKLEALLHAEGVLVGLPVAFLPEADEVHDLVGALEGRAARHARQAAHVGHHIHAEEAGDETLAFGHVAHLAADRHGLAGGIEAQDARLPLRRATVVPKAFRRPCTERIMAS